MYTKKAAQKIISKDISL